MFRISKGVSTQNKAGSRRPRLSLNFANGKLDSRVTFTRSTTGTFIGSNGLIQSAAINAPRFDYDPVTLAPKGLLIEEQRTNVILGSAAPVTQSVVFGAVACTLSFYGTGKIVLSGTYSATVMGNGAYPTRTTLTFTPTSGVLLLTITGSVQNAQLEAGSFATSYIPTTSAQVTRAADNASMTGTNFSDWFNQAEGTLVAETITFKPAAASSTAFAVALNDGTTSNFITNSRYSTNALTGRVDSGAVSQASATLLVPYVENTPYKTVTAYKANDFAFAMNGGTVTTDTAGTVPSVNQLSLGFLGSGLFLNGTIKNLSYYPRRLTNAELQAITT